MIDPLALGLTVISISGDEAAVICPFHDDHHASASFNVRKALFVCYACHEKSNAKKLARKLGGTVSSVDVVRGVKPKSEIEWRPFLLAPRYVNEPNGYLDRRGVTMDEAQEYEIRVTPRWLVFTLRDIRHDVKGVMLRSLTNDGPRYIKLGDHVSLWPFERLHAMLQPKGLVLTEGVFGAIRARRAGYDAFSTLGTAPDWGLMRSISSLIATIFFDDDFPGYRAALEIMALAPRAKCVLPGGDVDSLEAEEVVARVKKATHSIAAIQRRMKRAQTLQHAGRTNK